MSDGRNMLGYLINDIGEMFLYLPYLGVAAMGMFLITLAGNIGRRASGKAPRPVIVTTLFRTYIITILIITFLSRESGSRLGFDLEIGSTWGINNRNKALVIENVILFVPFGLLAAWSIPSMRNVFISLIWGTLFSWGIECMQLITQRGYFQIDDIITNALGTVIGLFIYTIAHLVMKKRNS